MNEGLLRRAAAAARAPRVPVPVEPRDVALLGAELGRPLPEAVRRLWAAYGAGWLGRISLWEPREIAQGIGLADRWIDEGLLPFAHGSEGDLWLLEMGGGDDPGVVAAAPPDRTRLGPLSAVVEMAALALLIEAEAGAADRPSLEARLAELQNPLPNRSM